MKRTLIIFEKDATHLWPQILAFVATLALFACEDPTYTKHEDMVLVQLTNLLYLVLPISFWLLVTSLMQEEKAVGHEQYWLARPFTWVDLLAAKALFLLAFVIVPVFVCQLVVLDANGFSPIEHFGELLVKQVFFAALLLLPMAAIGAVTKNLGHAFLGGLLLSMVLTLGSVLTAVFLPGSSWGALAWIRDTAVAAVALCGAAAVIYLQYTRRRASLGRGALGGIAALVLLIWALPPWQPAFAVQSWFSRERIDPHAVRIAFVPGEEPAGARPDAHQRDAYYNFPIRIDNLPPGLHVRIDWATIEAPWRSAWSRAYEISALNRGEEWLVVSGDDRASNKLIHVRGRLDLTVTAPSADQCWRPWVAPFPTSPWFGPIEKCTGDVEHSVAYIQRAFDLGPLRMADYRATVP